MSDLWQHLADRLGITRLHHHLERQENTMARISDELGDIRNRLDAMRDAQATSTTNVRDALARLEQKVTDLSDGELSDENQAKVDEIKAELDNVKTAAEGIDDGYEPPVVEPSPFPATPDDQPEPGSVEDRDRSGL